MDELFKLFKFVSKKNGRPGYITMKRGLDVFNEHLKIITFVKARDVYKE